MNENLVERFSSEVQVAEARCFYGFQIMMCVFPLIVLMLDGETYPDFHHTGRTYTRKCTPY